MENQRITIRSLGYTPGTLPTGPTNSILDIPGIHVGQVTVPTSSTLKAGSSASKGVTVISPRPPKEFYKPCHAGSFTLNGNGEVTGSRQVEDWGFTNTPIALTNSLSLGTVFDVMWDWVLDQQDQMEWEGLTRSRHYGTPVVGETADWIINADVRASRVGKDDVRQAFENLKSADDGGFVHEGQAGGGAGMTCHMFPGGTGTSSRVLRGGEGSKREYTIGVLCQSNYGILPELIIGGVPVGKLLQKERDAQKPSSSVGDDARADVPAGSGPEGRAKDGSIVIIIITDAPLVAHQLQRLARHATVGLAAVGGHGVGRTFSGDIFLALSTAEHGPEQIDGPLNRLRATQTYTAEVVKNESIDAYFLACAEAVEEAILNSIVRGRDGVVTMDGKQIEGLPVEKVKGILSQYLVKV